MTDRLRSSATVVDNAFFTAGNDLTMEYPMLVNASSVGGRIAPPVASVEDDEELHFKGGSLTCTAELNLFYLCFGVLGEEMRMLTSITSIIDATIERVLSVFLIDHAKTKMLLQLSTYPQVQERTYIELRDVLKEMLISTDLSDSLQLKEGLLELIRNLSRCVANKEVIYFDFCDVLCDSLTHGESLRITRFALGALNNLATFEDNAVFLFRRPMFVETILNLVLRGGTSTIRERALWTLQSLACADENEIPMFETPRMIDTLVVSLESGETVEVRTYAIETLRNLANQNSKKMVANKALLNALMNVVTASAPPAPKGLVDLAYSCLSRLGLNRDKIDTVHKLQLLCYPRDVPRICKGTSFAQIPNELIRRVGETLQGLGTA